MKSCLISLVISEMQNKSTINVLLPWLEWIKFKKTATFILLLIWELIDALNNVNKSQTNYTRWKMPDSKEYELCDTIYIKCELIYRKINAYLGTGVGQWGVRGSNYKGSGRHFEGLNYVHYLDWGNSFASKN